MIERVILWLAFLVLAIDFIACAFTHIVCILTLGWEWVKDSAFDFIVLAAMLVAEILIFTTIY